MAERKPLSFVLFPNKRKKEGTRHPDVVGTVTDENGKDWQLAGWKLKTKHGLEYVGGKVSEITWTENEQSEEDISEINDRLPF